MGMLPATHSVGPVIATAASLPLWVTWSCSAGGPTRKVGGEVIEPSPGRLTGVAGVHRGELSASTTLWATPLSGDGEPCRDRPFWSYLAATPATVTPLISMPVCDTALDATALRCVVAVSTTVPKCSSDVPAGKVGRATPGMDGVPRSTSCSVVVTTLVAPAASPRTSTCESTRPTRRPSAGTE